MSRIPLGELNPNRVPNTELSSYLRGKIERSHELGQGRTRISRSLEIPSSTVQYTLEQNPLRIDGESLPRAGRPKKYTEKDARRVVRFVRIHPKSTYREIKHNLHLYLSHDTFGRILADAGIKNWRAKQRPFLTPEAAKVRWEWAKKHSNWKSEWKLIIFSDECSVERGKGAQREWVFRSPSQKWDKDKVQTYKKGKDISIMVWRAIWKGGRSDLVIMARDESSAGNGYTANSYLDVLEEQIPICYQPGRTFMHDNARIHTAKKIQTWLEDNGIAVLDWPPYSPDMNPIEHVWAKLKELVHEMHPELMHMGKSEEDQLALSRAIIEAWEAIPQSYIDKLIEGMERRVQTLKTAKGWHTKY